MKKIKALMLFTLQIFDKDRNIFFVSLIFVTALRIMAPILVPFIIKTVFDLVSFGNYHKVVIMILALFVLFTAMVVIAYFVNTYVDTWLTKLINKNAGRCYEKLAQKDYGELIVNYSSEEIFNRIMAGSGNCVALWVQSINIISTLVSVILLFLMANRSSILVSVMIFIVVDTIRVNFEFRKNEKYASKIQK